MKAIVVSVALAMSVSAGRSYADPIQSAGPNAPSGAIAGLAVHGRALSLDHASGLESLAMSGLDARQNYQDHNWRAHLGAPAGFSLDDEGWDGSRVERSFLAVGGPGFGAYKADRSSSWLFRWSRIRDNFTHNHRHKHKRSDGDKDRGKHDDKGDKDNGDEDAENNHDGDKNGEDDCEDDIKLPGGGNDTNPVATPEPGAILLVGSGLIALARQARKRRDVR